MKTTSRFLSITASARAEARPDFRYNNFRFNSDGAFLTVNQKRRERVAKKIKITVNDKDFLGELNETETAKAIETNLPIEASPSFWGDEIYFEIPVDIEENENPEEELEVGDLAYWPDGNAFCIFYGPTPSSKGSEPRPASPVTVVGEVSGDATVLRQLDRGFGDKVKIEAAE